MTVAAERPPLPPPPPNQDELIRWKRTTIQHRNHYNPDTKVTAERCGHHRRHHKASWSNCGDEPHARRDVRRRPLDENISNLLLSGSQASSGPPPVPQEVLQRHLQSHDEHGNLQSAGKPRAPMHKSAIPKNAQKKAYTCVGHMGSGSGVANPREFCKAGSGSKGGPSVRKDVFISKPGEKAKKWTRPLPENFVPKMGRPKQVPSVAKIEDSSVDGSKPRVDFMASNKVAAGGVLHKTKLAPPPPPSLGKMPQYLLDMKAQKKMDFDRAETERMDRRKEKKKRKKFEKKRRMELLDALKKRRDAVLNQMVRADMGRSSEDKRKKLEVEISYLDKDIARLASGTIILTN